MRAKRRGIKRNNKTEEPKKQESKVKENDDDNNKESARGRIVGGKYQNTRKGKRR